MTNDFHNIIKHVNFTRLLGLSRWDSVSINWQSEKVKTGQLTWFLTSKMSNKRIYFIIIKSVSKMYKSTKERSQFTDKCNK